MKIHQFFTTEGGLGNSSYLPVLTGLTEGRLLDSKMKGVQSLRV